MPSVTELAPVLIVEGCSRPRAPAVLSAVGCPLERVPSGMHALARVRGRRFGVIIVDRSLVDMDALEFCRRLRSSGDWTPVLMLSADDAIDDRVRALDAGADDYAPTHLCSEEIIARVRALSRRRRPLTRDSQDPPTSSLRSAHRAGVRSEP